MCSRYRDLYDLAAGAPVEVCQLGGKAGFGISITEDVPPEHLARSLEAIARVIEAAG